MKILQYKTYKDALKYLYYRGFTSNLTWTGKHIKSVETGKVYPPNEVSIVEYHRFFAATESDNNIILFVLECMDGHKGLVASVDGLLADMSLFEFMNNVRIKARG